MGKIAILTLNGYFNYGNRLQNYAAQEVLKSLGFSVETIINETKPISIKNKENNKIRRINNLKGQLPKEIFNKINSKLWSYTHRQEIKKRNEMRTKIFEEFTSDYITETNYSIADNNIPDGFADRYDYFITGSDQVWNPSYNYGSSIYFLTFAPQSKRIAFSPSFGISEIPAEYLEQYKVWLTEMHRLSVREEAGGKIIKDLTGRNARVLVDPTLMLTKEEWLSIANESSNRPKGKYLLTYFLGSIPNQYESKIKKIAKENKLKIINLADIKDKETYQTGPSEFIDYINNASVFCTDSFHGAVFSILMETPFVVFDRKGSSLSMYSRIDTLLGKFNLNSRKASNITNSHQVFDIDYSHVAQLLENERNKALDYLKEAFYVEDKI